MLYKQSLNVNGSAIISAIYDEEYKGTLQANNNFGKHPYMFGGLPFLSGARHSIPGNTKEQRKEYLKNAGFRILDN